MCTAVVIDTNMFGTFLDHEKLLLRWIDLGHGILKYTNDDSFGYGREVQKSSRMRDLMGEYRRANRAELVPFDAIKQAETTLTEERIRSDDKHILALAKACHALVLCSNDKDLQKDFLDTQLLPKVGKRSRAVYPDKGPRRLQRDFLDRRRCRKR